MSAWAAPALAVAGLLVLAGAQKVIDPEMTVGALAQLGVPATPRVVRVGAGAELALGVVAITVGGAVAWVGVAASYVAFATVVVAALRRGTMIGSCGCFGREETPPHPSHVVANVVLAVVAVVVAARVEGAPIAGWTDDPGRSVLVGGLATVAVYLLYALYVELPRTLAAARNRP